METRALVSRSWNREGADCKRHGKSWGGGYLNLGLVRCLWAFFITHGTVYKWWILLYVNDASIKKMKKFYCWFLKIKYSKYGTPLRWSPLAILGALFPSRQCLQKGQMQGHLLSFCSMPCWTCEKFGKAPCFKVTIHREESIKSPQYFIRHQNPIFREA